MLLSIQLVAWRGTAPPPPIQVLNISWRGICSSWGGGRPSAVSWDDGLWEGKIGFPAPGPGPVFSFCAALYKNIAGPEFKIAWLAKD